MFSTVRTWKNATFSWKRRDGTATQRLAGAGRNGAASWRRRLTRSAFPERRGGDNNLAVWWVNCGRRALFLTRNKNASSTKQRTIVGCQFHTPRVGNAGGELKTNKSSSI